MQPFSKNDGVTGVGDEGDRGEVGDEGNRIRIRGSRIGSAVAPFGQTGMGVWGEGLRAPEGRRRPLDHFSVRRLG
jgi:hypothetical protein